MRTKLPVNGDEYILRDDLDPAGTGRMLRQAAHFGRDPRNVGGFHSDRT